MGVFFPGVYINCLYQAQFAKETQKRMSDFLSELSIKLAQIILPIIMVLGIVGLQII